MTPQKYLQNIISKNIVILLKTPNNIEIQIVEPQNWTEPTYIDKYQSSPTPGRQYSQMMRSYPRNLFVVIVIYDTS